MEQKDTQWEEELRRGILANLSYYRRRLQDQQHDVEPLDPAECACMVDMLNALEDFMRVAWEPQLRIEVTRRAAEKIRPGEGL